MQLGLIGLGKMGFNMRERLRGGGHEVVGYDPRPEVSDVPSLAALAERLARPRGKLSVGNWLRRALGDPVKVALLLEWGRPLPGDPAGWADLTKGLPLRHEGPMAIETAISSAGGVTWDSVTKAQELRALPDVFVAGEMLDWEAPTGGYLLTACLGSGLHAGRAAAARLASMAAG